MKRFLRGLLRHPKTTAMGIATLAGVIVTAVNAPEVLTQPQTWSAVLAAAGLLAAADGGAD